jgi:hypothetical protein
MATIPVTDVQVDGEDMFGAPAHEDALRRMMEMAGIKQLDELSPALMQRAAKKAGAMLNKNYHDKNYNATTDYANQQNRIEYGMDKRAGNPTEFTGNSNDYLKNEPGANTAKGSRMPVGMAEEQVQEGEECSTCHEDPCKCESVEESIRRMKEIAGIKEAKKPDYLDFDKDGDEKEPMTKALKDKEEKKVEESIFALTNQWKAYRG